MEPRLHIFIEIHVMNHKLEMLTAACSAWELRFMLTSVMCGRAKQILKKLKGVRGNKLHPLTTPVLICTSGFASATTTLPSAFPHEEERYAGGWVFAQRRRKECLNIVGDEPLFISSGEPKSARVARAPMDVPPSNNNRCWVSDIT